MVKLNNSVPIINQDLTKFENSRKNIVSYVKFFDSLQKQIVVIKPYFQGIVLLLHLNKIRTSPRELKKNIF